MDKHHEEFTQWVGNEAYQFRNEIVNGWPVALQVFDDKKQAWVNPKTFFGLT